MHPEARTYQSLNQNFAGYYINLSHLMDFGISMFSNLEEDSDVDAKTSYPLGEEQKGADRPSDPSVLQFDSRFESGNLYSVYSRTENVYDLIIQNDINTKGYTQWFYFRVTGTQADQTVKFNIVNFVRRLYSIPFLNADHLSPFPFRNCRRRRTPPSNTE